MTYRGHIKSGVAVLDERVNLPDGTPVRIIVVEEPAPNAHRTQLAALDRLAGTIDLDFQAIEDLRARSLV